MKQPSTKKIPPQLYHSHKNPTKKGRWSTKEESKFRTILQQQDEKASSYNWHSIAHQFFPHRTPRALQEKWERVSVCTVQGIVVIVFAHKQPPTSLTHNSFSLHHP